MSLALRRLMMQSGGAPVYATASGSVASFTTLHAAPLQHLIVSMTPQQSGSGDPAPDNVRPISGWNKVSAFVTGKNLWNPDISTDGTAIDKLEYIGQYSGYAVYGFPVPASTQFRVHASTLASGSAAIFIQSKRASADYGTAVSITNLAWAHDRILTSDESGYMYLLTNTTVSATIAVAAEAEVQVEVGNQTATVYEPYNGASYSATIPTPPGTVYGGTLNVITGVLTVTMTNIASYAGETIGEPWLSSKDKYVPGATPTTGAQVVYTLTTPVTYQLTGQQITDILGNNNVWSDAGDVSVTYRSN